MNTCIFSLLLSSVPTKVFCQLYAFDVDLLAVELKQQTAGVSSDVVEDDIYETARPT